MHIYCCKEVFQQILIPEGWHILRTQDCNIYPKPDWQQAVKKVGSPAPSNRQYNALLIGSGFDNKGHIFGASHLNLVWKTPIYRPCVHQPSPRDTNFRVSCSILSKPIIVRIRLEARGCFWPTVFVQAPKIMLLPPSARNSTIGARFYCYPKMCGVRKFEKHNNINQEVQFMFTMWNELGW